MVKTWLNYFLHNKYNSHKLKLLLWLVVETSRVQQYMFGSLVCVSVQGGLGPCVYGVLCIGASWLQYMMKSADWCGKLHWPPTGLVDEAALQQVPAYLSLEVMNWIEFIEVCCLLWQPSLASYWPCQWGCFAASASIFIIICDELNLLKSADSCRDLHWHPTGLVDKACFIVSNWTELIHVLWIQNRLIPWIWNKSGKYYIPTLVAGTIQLIKLSLLFSTYIQIFFDRVERVSI
jgi:hypothetical protein